jgi:hypothetical protein
MSEQSATDHRAEAEKWIEKAKAMGKRPDARAEQVSTAALIAIWHDLHRIADAMTFIPTVLPAEDEEVTQ